MVQKYVLSSQISNNWLKKISIDSLNLRIPLSEVELIGDNIGKIHTTVNKETGESFEDFKKHSEKYNYKGVSVHWRLEDQYDKGIVIPYLVILVSSKILRERYFEGITKDNSKLVYDNITELGIAKFTYESFLKAQCTDVDFKKDIYCKSFGDVIEQIQKISKSSPLSNRGYNSLNKRKKGILINQGLEFGKRKTASTAYPFLKFYHKYIELVYSSGEFYRAYIEPLNLDIANLIRTEFTIKNKTHFLKYKIENTGIENILNLDQSTLESIMNDILGIHLDKRVKVIEVKTKTSMRDNYVIQSLYWSIKNGMSYDQIKNSISVSNIKDSSQAKRRFYAYLDNLYKDHIEGSPEDKTSIELDSFFTTLGLS